MDPSIYLMDDDNKSSTNLPAQDKENCSEKNKNESATENSDTAPSANQANDNICTQIDTSGKAISEVDMVSGALRSLDVGGSAPDCKGEILILSCGDVLHNFRLDCFTCRHAFSVDDFLSYSSPPPLCKLYRLVLTLTIFTGEIVKNADATKPPIANKEKAGPEPIVIPIILKMAEFDHKVCQNLLLFSIVLFQKRKAQVSIS